MTQTITREESPTVLPAHALRGPLPYTPVTWTVPALALALVITVAAYLPVLFNWFAGDDFTHLIWLKDAMQNPELIWRNFHANWLDVKTTKFYRPLISVFMALDYSIWGANGLGFHLTNLAFLLFSCVAIFFITKELLRSVPNSKATTCAFIASTMFGLYPLHCEPVSWITGRVDSVVTAFYLGSMWCYIRWRSSNHSVFAVLAWTSMVLALCSKEMAIMIPPTLSVYEFILGAERRVNPLLKSLRDAVKFTVPFWLTLALYFVVRHIALGTFVGGYDDSLFFIPDLKQFALNWIHSLSMLFAPANRLLMSPNNLLLVAWKVSFGIVSLVGLWNFCTIRELRKQYLFLALWFALALAPVYKLFSISDDLQGSRLAYLCTAALCCFFGLSFARLDVRAPKWTLQTAALCIAFLLFPISAFGIISRNNSAWATAGDTSNKIRASLQRFYDEHPGDPQVLLVGLPDNLQGAYVVRNALEGMTKSPQLSRDISNCLAVNVNENILPFGYFKDSIASAKNAHVLFWDKQSSTLQPVDIRLNSQSANGRSVEIRGADLSRAVGILNNSCTTNFNSSGELRVSAPASKSVFEEVNIQVPPVACMGTNFVVVSVKNLAGTPGRVELFYKNNIVRQYDLEHRSHADLNAVSNETQELIFSLRPQPDWALGGTATEFKLRFPAGTDVAIKQIKAAPASSVMPDLSAQGADYSGTKGFLHLDTQRPTVTISFDASSVPNASAVQLEVTRGNQFFEEQNTRELSRFAAIVKTIRGTTGSFELDKSLFPQQALYQIRIWAVDSNDKRTGVAGDHLMVSVDG